MRPLISSLPEYAARSWSGAAALNFPGIRAMTFSEIDELTRSFAGGLARLGVRPGDRVVLHLPNSWQWVLGYYGILRAGAIVIPANILLSPAEMEFILADTAAKVLITTAERRGQIAVRPEYSILTEHLDGFHFFEAMLGRNDCPVVDLQPSDLCTIAYTSGTTGKPKGAMLTHGNIFSSTCQTATIHMRTSADRIYSALPLCHVYGNVVLSSCFLTGARLIAPARFDAAQALRTIEEEKVTLFEGVPTMYHQILAHPDVETRDFSSLTRCTVGGQTMPVSKLQAVSNKLGCPVLELWGMTELGGPAISHSQLWPERLGSIGLPFPGTTARIADLNHPAQEAPRGAQGELMIRGPLVMRGYWNRPDATSEVLDAQGWLATGDIAVMDEDGYLTIMDRKKDMIITAGYNIYPAELEQAIASHPCVSMVAVIGVPDEEKGEIPHAHVVLRPDSSIDDAELLAHCRKLLAAYKVPRQIWFVESLPLTSTGKIARRLLRKGSSTQ